MPTRSSLLADAFCRIRSAARPHPH